MKVFYLTFMARYRNAIGIREHFTREVKAETYDKAVLKLYDEFDHISVMAHTEWEESNHETK